MESLYAVLFSNGHIKVGRSDDALQRIKQHTDRVACMGVTVEDFFTVNYDDGDEAREQELINRCVQECEGRFLSEWFSGLSFKDVCIWAAAAAQREMPAVPPNQTRWTLLIGELRAAGWTHADLARECKCGAATISRIALGQQEEPMYSVGERLLWLRTPA